MTSESDIFNDLDLKSIDYYLPKIDFGKVLKVYDGDSFTIACKPNNCDDNFYKYSIRIKDIDCPELRSNNEKEKRVAKLAKKLLHEKIFDKIVFLKNIEFDKYAKRIVADVYFDNIKISDIMIENGLAVEYDGGKKNPPECWLEYYQKKTDSILDE